MYIDISKLDHAAVMERTWEEWRAIFSLEEKAYGMKLKGYRGKQRLVYLPDFICRVEGFNPDCAIICHKRVFDKFGPNIKLNSAVAYLKEPDRFPGDYSKAPRNYIKQERDLVLQRIISTNDVEALAAFIEFMGKTTDLKNLDIIIAAAEESHDIRNYALELKNKLYSPNDIDKLYMIQEEKDLGLRELTVEDCKKNWSYKKRDDGSLCLTLYKGEDKDIVIPVKIGKSFVSEIGDHVILPANRYYNPKYQERRLLVRSVLIPEGIKRIGIEAFAECKNLVNVTFPDSLTEIGAGAFRGCDGLKDPDGRLIVGGVLYRYESDEEHVVIPDNIRQIDNEVFKNRRNLKAVTLPESICSIGDEAFYGCTALMTINLPEGLRHIGASAFQGCPGLADSGGFVIIKHVFAGYFGNESEIVIPAGIRRIDNFAFWNAGSIRKVILPQGLENIGESAFRDRVLENIEIPETVRTIEEYAFGSCRFKSVNLPDGLTSLGNGAFEGCQQLEEITIPGNVKEICYHTFFMCYSLQRVTIKPGVQTIRESAFSMCEKLGDIEIPGSVTRIERDAFYGCKYLTCVFIPDSVTFISKDAFSSLRVICGKSGSYAEKYAKENDLSFVAK